VVTALNEAFYLAFKAITPTGKNTLLALDVSSSMRDPCPGLPMISCAEGAAVMAMVTARAEPNWHVVGFTGNYMQSQTKLVDLGINPTMSLEDVMLRTRMSNFGTTDCSLPMTWARENKIEVDSFAVYTDNETYAGTIHPHQALEAYRQKMGRPAKEAVIGMVGNPFTIADPSDPGQLDVVGMDTAVPAVLADFFRDATAKREPLEAVVEESVEE
jgi:60 kDa SS-A/Ro ribonucleoprotein